MSYCALCHNDPCTCPLGEGPPRTRTLPRRPCSWCHHENPVGQTFCSYCRHRADLCRMECDCPWCLPMSHVNVRRTRAAIDATRTLGVLALETGTLQRLLAEMEQLRQQYEKALKNTSLRTSTHVSLGLEQVIATLIAFRDLMEGASS